MGTAVVGLLGGLEIVVGALIMLAPHWFPSWVQWYVAWGFLAVGLITVAHSCLHIRNHAKNHLATREAPATPQYDVNKVPWYWSAVSFVIWNIWLPVLAIIRKIAEHWKGITITVLAIIAAVQWSYIKQDARRRANFQPGERPSIARLVYSKIGVEPFDVPGVGRLFSFKLYFANKGDAAAKGVRLFAQPFISDTILSSKDEDVWIERVLSQARKPDLVQYPENSNEMQPGDTWFFGSRAGLGEKRYNDFKNGNAYLYIFAVETYSDPSSENAATVVCIYYYKGDLATWHSCNNHNQIVRGRW